LKSSVSTSPVGIETTRSPKPRTSRVSNAFIAVSRIARAISIGQSIPPMSRCDGLSTPIPACNRKPQVGRRGAARSKRKTGKALATPPSTRTASFFVTRSRRVRGGKKYG
jgi:hypothetical protein